tara:strand:- start:216 stop:371 length:156 start_codon:yes stop_codon:yes gene_type:complete
MSSKMAHKKLKKEVNVLEQVRNNDRSFETWKQLKEGKKLKLKAKEKLNEIK